MNDLTMLRDAGPRPAPLTDITRLDARAALLGEIAGDVRPARFRWRRPAMVVGVAVVTAAAAWAAATVIAMPDPTAVPASSVVLVPAEPPTFPFALDPTPPGLDVEYSADPGGARLAHYGNPDGDGFTVVVTPADPGFIDPAGEQDVTVQGRDGELVTARQDWVFGDGGTEVRTQELLVLEWDADEWLKIAGTGAYDERAALLDLANRLVATPVDVGLQVGVAPVGWSVQAYKDDSILTLADDAAPDQTLTVQLAAAAIPADELRAQLERPVGPVQEVVVQGSPAQLVQVETGWYLQAQLPDGGIFVVQAPPAFTEQQVLDVADQVTVRR